MGFMSVHETHIEAFQDENKSRTYGFTALSPRGGDCLPSFEPPYPQIATAHWHVPGRWPLWSATVSRVVTTTV